MHFFVGLVIFAIYGLIKSYSEGWALIWLSVWLFLCLGCSIYFKDEIKAQELDEINYIKEKSKKVIDKHFDVLYVKYMQLRYKDEYGYWHNEKWYKTVDYFLLNVFLNEIPSDAKKFMRLHDFKYKEFFYDYFNQKIQELKNDNISKIKLEQVKTGIDFELYIKSLLENHGYEVQTTPKTGDQGVDLIVKTDTDKIAIQCKFYSQPVGNKAVQEVASGKVFYKCTKAIVVSNQSYTVSARELAQNLNVELLNEKTLISYLETDEPFYFEETTSINNNTTETFFATNELAKFTCKNRKKDGLYKTYYENGDLRQQGMFKNNKKIGLWLSYYKNNKLKEETNYILGKKEGIYKVYYQNGTLKQESIYKNNKIDGITKIYTFNGNIKYEISYLFGIPEEGYQYDKNKKRIKMTITEIKEIKIKGIK